MNHLYFGDCLDVLKMRVFLKKVILFLQLFFIAAIAVSQSTPEDIYEQYHSAKTEEGKAGVLDACFESLAKGSFADRALAAIKVQDYFKSKGDVWGTGYLQLAIASTYRLMGEYSSSLKYSLSALKNFENGDDTSAHINTLMQIGSSFRKSQNIRQGLIYYKKCTSILEPYHGDKLYRDVLNEIAICYNDMNEPDSALSFANEAVSLAVKYKDSQSLVIYYSTIGKIYLAKKDHELARIFLSKNLQHNGTNSSALFLATVHCELAKSFYATAEYSNVILNAEKAASYAAPEYKKELMEAYEWLYKAYEQQYVPDNVNKYFRLAATIKDSLFTVEKNRSLQAMDFEERLRQQEIETAKLNEAAERKESLSYVLVSLGIIVFIGVFLLLSRSIITNPKIIKVLGIMALLIVFEFFNLLLHPFLERVTDHSPFFMLLALVCIAAILAPLHHKAEKWAINKLIAKNKEIRLAAAKRTIEILEKEKGN